MKLCNCNICPLRQGMFDLYTPCQPHMIIADYMIVSFQPTEDEIMLGIKSGIEFDLLSKVIKVPFYFTHLVKCTGKATSKIVTTCMRQWLKNEIEALNPKFVVTMGKEVAYHLIPEVKRKDSIREIAGKKYICDGQTFIPTFSSASILNGGKSALNSFRKVFNGI